MTQTPVHALLPVKGFGDAKGRLSALLSAAERAALAEAMLRDVLAALGGVPQIEKVWVVSADRAVQNLASTLGAIVLAEPASVRGLNGALSYARDRVASGRTETAALLTLHADLPAVSADAIRAFLDDLPEGPFVRLCPAPDNGTNALLQRPCAALPFHFGKDSAVAHAAEARQRGLPLELRRVGGLEHDLDEPADVARRGEQSARRHRLPSAIVERILELTNRNFLQIGFGLIRPV